MHQSIVDVFERGILAAEEVAGRKVLEVGSLDVNGSVRPIIEAFKPASYLGVDAGAGPRVDRVVDATTLVAEFGEASFDVVITTEMLEHAEDWKSCVINLAGVLAEGGLLVITTRSPGFPWHGFPWDYWRYTPQVMGRILDAVGLDLIECYPDPDPLCPGVVAKAAKPFGWTLASIEYALDAPEVQPTPIGPKPLTVLGYPHNADGSGWYRYYLPFRQVARHSNHVVLLPEPGTKFTPNAEEVGQFDAISAQRLCGPDGVMLWDQWKGRTALIYETDDDILRPDQAAGLPHMFHEDVRQTFRYCLAMADMITVSTEPLAEQMRHHNQNVRVLPNHIDGDVLYLDRQRRDRLTIGWAGGMSHMGDWAVAADPIGRVLDTHPDVDMHFIGWDYSPILRRHARYTPWKINVWDYYKGIDFDIGLAPLADTPFNTCKSHLKALEYAALGIPVIASNVPAYNEFVIDGVTGYLVSTPDEWRSRLIELINDRAAREEMGAKGRERAADYIIQRGWRLWNDAFQEVTGWRP